MLCGATQQAHTETCNIRVAIGSATRHLQQTLEGAPAIEIIIHKCDCSDRKSVV